MRIASTPALLLAATGSLAAASSTAAQQPANWSGAIRCEIRAEAPGYFHQETQTWTLTGAAPTVQGSVHAYPATWSVAGQGWHDRTRGANRRIARWTTSAPAVVAPIGFTTRPIDRGIDVGKWHAQLTAGGGYTGTDQYINDGVAQPTGRLVMTLYEWQFPKIEVAATETQVTGSHTAEVRAFVGPLQPGEAQAIVTCAWALGRGAAPGLPAPTLAAAPPPPPTGSTPPSATTATAAPPAMTPVAVPGLIPLAAPGLIPGAPTGTGATTPPSSAPPGTVVAGPGASGLPIGQRVPPALTPSSPPAGGAPVVPADPANFRARQTADGTVVLTWDAVPGAGSYLVGGPGTNVGISVTGLSHTITGLAPGTHTWMVATMYNPGGILTAADRWSRATASVVNTSGRYRMLLTGFRLSRATFDDRVGGNGDEVYASAAVTTIDRRDSSVLQPRTVIRSATYGDISRDARRVRAGSFSPTGGLWAGDAVPAGGDPRAVTSVPSSTQFPLALWEGTLRDGIDAVAINPVLWEEDGQLEYYNEWADANSTTRRQPARAAAQAAAIHDRATRSDLSPFRGMLVFICSSASDLIPDCKPGNDRPIGIGREGCVGDTFASNLLAWCDVTVVVTREAVERALTGPAVGAAGAGVVVIPLVEPSGVDPVKGGLDGSYELYLRVERVP